MGRLDKNGQKWLKNVLFLGHFFPKKSFFLKKKNLRSSEIPNLSWNHKILYKLIFLMVKQKTTFSPKIWDSFAKSNPGHKKKSEVNTSKLDIQYTKLLVWVVWPEEPPEIHFFEKCSDLGKFGSHILQFCMENDPKWV